MTTTYHYLKILNISINKRLSVKDAVLTNLFFPFIVPLSLLTTYAVRLMAEETRHEENT